MGVRSAQSRMPTTILFLTSPDICFQEDILHEGLDELLGPERVYCYPYKDYSVFQYNFYDEPAGGPGHRRPVELIDILDMCEAFDAVIVGSIRPEAVAVWREIQDRFPRCPVALLHGEERGGWPAGIRYTHRFKMEMYSLEPDLFPLPLAAPPRVMLPADTERDIAVSFVARPTVEVRVWCAELLRRQGYTVYLGADLPRDQFCWILNRSKIAVSLRGVAWDTFRYWEIPYHGALLLSERLPILIPDNFVDGESAVFFGSPGDMLDKIEALLADPERLARIAAAGQALSRAKHTSTARARYVLEKMGILPS